ncbi:uracil-DNA glycosylase [Sphingobium sp. AR-3-1]|uniref:Uracil-DNA glycosylase n=1 Tax=Sphingobium psychrophilum TaxID=2728834 RepID=A0A7X9WXE0_9SPHN|nr:uracil-DNA glycosylase family protein [Sphingobium psychrophilum]NML11671.1 uracil-DNA glycosylase [Sphingobium psychrophilum]
MRGLLQDDAATADAYLAWWQLAGVDSAIGESPVNWLRPVAARPVTMTAAVVEKPQTLESFLAWLAHDPAQPERRWAGTPIAPTGPAQATLMVVTDLPDPADMSEGRLLADRAGLLFDAMLRAIGLDRDAIHLASLFTARPPGGMVEASDLAHAADRMRTHVALAQPRRLLLLGDRTIRALMPTDGASPANSLRQFNHDGGIVPAIATFHPRLLLTQPAAKAECWRTLQSLIEETRP